MEISKKRKPARLNSEVEVISTGCSRYKFVISGD
jgi:hypothetical protein